MIKSNNPHLAGGELYLPFYVIYIYIYVYVYVHISCRYSNGYFMTLLRWGNTVKNNTCSKIIMVEPYVLRRGDS